MDARDWSKREPNYPPRDSPATKLGEARWGLLCRGLISIRWPMFHPSSILPSLGRKLIKDARDWSKHEPERPPRDGPATKLGEARRGLFCRGLIYSMGPCFTPPQASPAWYPRGIKEEAVGGRLEPVETRAKLSAP